MTNMNHFFISVFLNGQLQDYFFHWGYFGIFLWFITIDQVIPIPEEITLVVIGYLSSAGILNPVFAGIFTAAAFLSVDLIYYFLTKSGNRLIRKLTQKSESSFAGKFREKLDNNLPKTLLILCFIPRMRLLAPVFVALSRQPFRRFIIYDTLGICIFCTVYISAGYIFHRSISALVTEMGILQHVIFAVAIAAMLVLTLLIMRRTNRP